MDFEFNPAVVSDGQWPHDSGLSVDQQKLTAAVQSQNAQIFLELTPSSGVSLTLTLNDRLVA